MLNKKQVTKVKGWTHISQILAQKKKEKDFKKFVERSLKNKSMGVVKLKKKGVPIIKDNQPTQKEIEEQIKHAFREFVIVGGMLGLKVPREAIDAVWNKFYKGLSWRIDALYKKNGK